MEFFRRGNANEEKNETVEMPAVAEDIEPVELGADDQVAIQSAREAVEAMKNNSFFGRSTVESDKEDLRRTTPVFTEEQLKSEVVEEVPESAEAQTTVAAVTEFDGPATSAAEAVARMNLSTPEVEEVVSVEEDPEWKINMDVIETVISDKSADIFEAVKVKLAEVESLVELQLKEMQDSIRSKVQFAEDSVALAVKEAGSSTEKVVEAEKVKLTSAFELEKQTMNENFEHKLKEIQEQHAAEIRELKEAQNQEITQMKDDQLNSLDKMKQMYSDQMEEMQTAYREKNAALKREMDQYKEKLDILMLEHEADPFSAGGEFGGEAAPAAPAPAAPAAFE